MKVCIVQTYIPLYSVSFFNRIVEMNPEIELVLLADLKREDVLNQYSEANAKFKVQQLDAVDIAGVVYRPKIIRVLQAINAEVTVFNASPREWSQLFAMCWMKLIRRPFVAWGMFHRIGGSRLFTKYYFKILGILANQCLTYSRIGAVNLLNIGVPKRKIKIVGTAIDQRIPQQEVEGRTQSEIDAFKIKHELEGKQIILHVARLTPGKRSDLLIRAIGELVNDTPNILLVVIGEGQQRAQLETLVDELQLRHYVRFLGGIYDEAVLSNWYLSATVFVLPTFLGLSGHHAMAYGLPVITDDSLDTQGSEFEIIANGLNALTYKEGDYKDLAKVLNQIFADNALQEYLSANARRSVSNIHNLDTKTVRFTQYLNSIM